MVLAEIAIIVAASAALCTGLLWVLSTQSERLLQLLVLSQA